MRDARPISSPMDPNEKLSSNDSSGLADVVRYRQLVGLLIWLLNTRLDVSFVVGILSSFMQQSRKSHMRLTQRVLQYLRDTSTLGLWYSVGGSDSAITLRGWCDSDWGGNPDSRRSTTGYVFSFGFDHLALSRGSVRSSRLLPCLLQRPSIVLPVRRPQK